MKTVSATLNFYGDFQNVQSDYQQNMFMLCNEITRPEQNHRGKKKIPGI